MLRVPTKISGADIRKHVPHLQYAKTPAQSSTFETNSGFGVHEQRAGKESTSVESEGRGTNGVAANNY